MIGGATRGSGGGALGRHLSNEAKNEQVIPLEGRGLIARDVRDQVAELTEMGAHARTRTPLYHVHADPPADRPWSEDERRQYWERFEAEFGLEGRPFAAVGHLKDGRLHEHRVYLRIRDDGTAIRLDHDHARREKLHRLFEIERGEQLTPGAHNRAVIAAMEREGRHEAAQAMREAGLDTMERPRADTTPRQRAQAERTGADPRAVGAAALAAWQASDGGRAFAAALEERGLRLAQGTKAPVIIDAEGGAHPLARMLGKESKAAGTERIRAADVAARLDGLDLPRHAPGAGRRPAPADQVPEPERILVAEEAAPAEDRPGTAPSSADEAAAPSAADPIP
ncbi:relaxase/mobilization nuclease domain-containing protein, partial [Roseomonas mucosa]